MTWKMRDGRFVKACPSIDIDCVDDLIRCLGGIDSRHVSGPILTSWCEQEASVGGECESAKERRESLSCVDTGVLESETTHSTW